MKVKLVVNLIAFAVLTLGLLAYGVFDLLGNPLQHPRTALAIFPDASGVEPNFGVVLNGVVVGSVSGVTLTERGARVVMAFRPGTDVPSNVVASISLANDLGEQQVELTPKGPASSTELASGAMLPVAKHGIPQQVGSVIRTASRLLRSIGAKPLNSVLGTLDESLVGESANLKAITGSSAEFSEEFLTYERQFEALLANSAPLLDTLTSQGSELRQDLANTAVLANVLDSHREDLVHLLANGAKASSVADELLTATRPDLACILHDFADVSANIASPVNLSNLAAGLATNEWFFGAVNDSAPAGPAKSLFPGDPAKADQIWLRTRLFIPPANPPATEYPTPTQLGPVLPGAACETEFGDGVGPASQSAPQRPVAGTRVVPPTSSDAHVNGTGGDKASVAADRTPPSRPTPTDARARPTAMSLTGSRSSSRGGFDSTELVALIAAALFAFTVLMPRARARKGHRAPRSRT